MSQNIEEADEWCDSITAHLRENKMQLQEDKLDDEAAFQAFCKEEARLDAIYEYAYEKTIGVIEELKIKMMKDISKNTNKIKKEYSTQDEIDAVEEGVRDALNQHKLK